MGNWVPAAARCLLPSAARRGGRRAKAKAGARAARGGLGQVAVLTAGSLLPQSGGFCIIPHSLLSQASDILCHVHC